MSSNQPNPIYERLTRGRKGPSARAATWIGIGVGAAAVLIAYLPAYYPDRTAKLMDIALIILRLVELLAVFTLGTGLIVSTVLTAGLATEEDFALLRISTLSAGQIVAGCVYAARDRLRLLRTITFWLMPAGLIHLAYLFGHVASFECGGGLYPPCGNLTPIYISVGLVPALLLIAPGMSIFYFLWPLTLNLGVWIGLSWGRSALAMAGGVLLAAVLLFILIVAVHEYFALILLLVCPALGVAAPAVTLALAPRLQQNAASAIRWRAPG